MWDLVAEVGLFKLRGHKDQIVALHWLYAEAAENGVNGTSNGVRSEGAFILSASKDALVKIWDVESQHCIETHIAQTNGECWAMGVTPDMSGCITAGSDAELKVWSIDLQALAGAGHATEEKTSQCLHDRGILRRKNQDRTTAVTFHPQADYFAVHGSDKAVEIWRIRSDSEVQKTLARKRRRKREKAAANGETVSDADGDDTATATISDVFVPYTTIRAGGKVRAVDWINTRSHKSLQLLASCTNNELGVFEVPTFERSSQRKEETVDFNRTFSVDLPGHRTDVRSLALSSDDKMLASASSGSLKIWNVKTGTCLRTLECGYALCCAFLPGDRIVVVGTKAGELELFDIASSTLLESVPAHEGAVMALQIHPDGRSLVSGSADKSAKFWKFEIVEENIPGTRRTTPRLKLVQTRVLKVNDDILSLCYTPDARLLAVSTLDNTVKVFFDDSLKLFLTLYGHKLPVLNMSVSSDSKIIATCSADKNVRLWGLDFGDCHKAFFAHQDSVMQVSFIPQPPSRDEAHHIFSASRDRTIKSWDGDKFEQVQKLEGHHGEIWAMVVSKTGDFLVTASHDKSIRIWNLTDEPIFLEEEREKEMEQLYENTLTTSLEADLDGEGEGEQAEAAAASKQTVATLTAGERIMEALDLGMEDLRLVRDWQVRKEANPNLAPPQRDPHFLANNNVSAERYVLSTLQKIPASQLQDALLVLPFSVLPALFTFIEIWIHRQWDITLVCRVLFFMLKTHQRQIVASRELKQVLEGMRRELRSTLGEVKDLLGFNLAAVRFVGEKAGERGIVRIEDVEKTGANEGKERKKRAFVDVS